MSAVPSDVATFRFESSKGDLVVLTVPGTEYRLHLVLRRPISVATGKRVKGTVHARALRAHRSNTGGRFIEPVYGTPRIVQGFVLAVDESKNRLLMDMVVPMWVSLDEKQSANDFAPGEMLNFYVESGTAFEPGSS